MNGHAIIYGMRRWGHPEWMPEDRKAMEPIFERHVKALAERYGARVQRWDVVNESIDQANRGLMPDDYTFKTFRWAAKYFPSSVRLGINDCDIHGGPSRRYVEIVRDLIDRGVRIDTVGVQMHIYNPKESQRIADGADTLTPAKNYAVLDCLRETERPIHISEVTVTPRTTPRRARRSRRCSPATSTGCGSVILRSWASPGGTWWTAAPPQASLRSPASTTPT